MGNPSPTYRGRFAPSPTGELHFGSLIAALASYLDARAAGGQWLLRVENLDPPREVQGSADLILRTLEAFGFEWDGPVLYQSNRFDHYREIAEQLKREQLAYPCSCSRKEIAAIAKTGIEGHIYPGTCRNGHKRDKKGRALRLLTDDREIYFHDRIQGEIRQRLESQFGDFIIRRADELFAYQLAVVADDREQGITDVVRGCDLLHSTTRQIHLQQCLNYPEPNYAHLPLATGISGRKLSKSDTVHPVDPTEPQAALQQAMVFLGQSEPPAEIGSVREFWQWAPKLWDLTKVPKEKSQAVQPFG